MNSQKNSSEEKKERCLNNLQLQDEIDYVTIGRHMRDVRKNLHFTQAQLSERMGLKPNYYGQYETGIRHINIPRFIQFVFTTKCSADSLLIGCHKRYPSVTPEKLECSEVRKELNNILDKCDDDLLQDIIRIVEILRKKR